jgi:hypothetical protein
LSQVYDELVGFDGNEFHFIPVPPTLFDETFQKACLRFEGCVVIGVYTANDTVLINPGMGFNLGDGDDLIVICESLDTVVFLSESRLLPAYSKMGIIENPNSGKVLSNNGGAFATSPHNSGRDSFVTNGGPDSFVMSPGSEPERPDMILCCGWRRNLRDIIIMLNMLATKKCCLHILCDIPVEKRVRMLSDDGLNISKCRNMEIVHFEGNSARRSHLEDLAIEEYSAILIVADISLENNAMANDSHALASLLLIRSIQKARVLDPTQRGKCTVMCEFLDNRARFMAHEDESDNHTEGGSVHSHDVVSRVMAMVAGRPQLKVVLDELLGYQGASIHVKPLSRYVKRREMVSFWTVAQRAWDYNEILIGRFMSSLGIIEMNAESKDTAESWSGYSVLVIAHTAKIGKKKRKTAYGNYRTGKRMTGTSVASFVQPAREHDDDDDDED